MKRTPLHEVRDQQFDVLIIGGGLVGAAVARDAAMRGYRTLLLESQDFGSGSTSRTSHLLAGGTIFLERGDLKLLRQLERERSIQLAIAPHLVRPINSVYAVLDSKTRPAGLKQRLAGSLHGWLLPEGSMSKIKPLSTKKVQALCPLFAKDGPQNGYQTLDGHVDFPERLCLENLLSAERNNARLSNYSKVVSVQVHNRQVQGITAEDRITGKSVRLLSRCVINAGGAWLDQISSLADDRYVSRLRLRQETYIALPQPQPPLNAAVVFSSKADNQPLEAVPWDDKLLVGPLSGEAGEDFASPKCGSADVDYLISELRRLFCAEGLDRRAVLFTLSGMRLQALEPGRSHVWRGSRALVIDHGRAGGPKGFISVVNGRLGSYRWVAEQAVDAVRNHGGAVKAANCATHAEPLFGGNIQSMATFIDEVSNAARNFALSEDQVRHLIALYGTKSQEIFQWLKNMPQLREPICPHQLDIKAQLLYSVEREMAVTVGDIFLRRLAIGWTRCRGLDCATGAAATLSMHLGWSEARVRAEIDNYRQELDHVSATPGHSLRT